MVDRFIVDARIGKICEYVALLRKINRQADEKKFIKDPLVYGNADLADFEKFIRAISKLM